MFNTALFTITKIRKQPKYPPMDEWIKKNVTHIHTHTHTHTEHYPSDMHINEENVTHTHIQPHPEKY